MVDLQSKIQFFTSSGRFSRETLARANVDMPRVFVGRTKVAVGIIPAGVDVMVYNAPDEVPSQGFRLFYFPDESSEVKVDVANVSGEVLDATIDMTDAANRWADLYLNAVPSDVLRGVLARREGGAGNG